MDLDDSTEPVPADRRCGEFLVDIGGIGGVRGQATVSHLNAANRYDAAANIPIQLVKDGVDVAIPPSVLGKEFHRVVFRVVTAVRLDDRATTPILDTMPDAGAAVALGTR